MSTVQTIRETLELFKDLKNKPQNTAESDVKEIVLHSLVINDNRPNKKKSL